MTEEKVFKTRNASDAFWSGFSKQTIDFQHALGELIDNALSAAPPKTVGEGVNPTVVEITLEENAEKDVIVQVADSGRGVKWEDLTGEENIFNLGYRSAKPGHMNEHGFGLKNALALMTSGFFKPFLFLTKTTESPTIYGVAGPIREEMVAKAYDESEWNKDLDIVLSEKIGSGTKLRVEVKREYFNSLYNRATSFETLVERLGEHLGVMYSVFLSIGHEIFIRYKARDGVWVTKKVPSIPTPFLQNEVTKKEQQDISVECGGKTYTVTYVRGLLDQSVKQADAAITKGWPYPLRIHFQGSNARCGLSYVVRNRVLKTGVFREIWPEHAGDVSFNNFLGELHLRSDFGTTNNKTDIDPHSSVWPLLVEKIKDSFPPEKTTKKASEESLRKQIIQQIINVHSLTKDKTPKKKVVWDGGGEIDIFYAAKGEIVCIETKIEAALVKDVYQLLMYWDGLVEEGIKPTKGILVAAGVSPNVAKAISHINQLKDKNGTQYMIEAQLIKNMVGRNIVKIKILIKKS